MTIRLFLIRWFHWTVEEFEILANPNNCEMTILEKLENGKYKLQVEPRKLDKKHKFQRPISIVNLSFFHNFAVTKLKFRTAVTKITIEFFSLK